MSRIILGNSLIRCILGIVLIPLVMVATAAPAAAEKRLDVRLLESQYVATLDLLSRGENEAALSALMVMEREALGDAPSISRIDRVWRHKLGVVRKAQELSSPEVLVPVIVLHHDAYERYRAAKMPTLARHSRDMAIDLATYKVQTTKLDEDREFAGWVLASFGVAVLDLRTAGTSASILRDALHLSPTNPAALQGLAWAHEIHGEYDDAVELLARLLEVQPDLHVARLRMAVCLRRQDELELAEKAFRQVLAGSDVPWVRALAYQELARTLLNAKETEKAETVLGAAQQELPTDQDIAILASFLEDQGGRSEVSKQVLERVVAIDSAEISPRYRYDSRPDLGIEQARETLNKMMQERLDVLASGLRWWGTETEESEDGAASGGEGR